MPLELTLPTQIRWLARFGAAVGVEVGPANLEIAAVRVRPNRVQVLGRTTIRDYASRPAAEWGAEYARFAQGAGAGHLDVTALLPRREVIVRQLALPGVAPGDMEGAIRLQLDSLHPFGEDEIAWGWSPAGRNSALVGIVRRSVMERYLRLFTEAGIPVSRFTFSAAAMHAAVRLKNSSSSDGYVALGETQAGTIEAYGESAARPAYSAVFEAPAERAAALAISELRLPPETAPLRLDQALPRAEGAGADKDFSRNALPYATALAGACPRLAPAANLLPQELRTFRSRTALFPTLALAGALMVCVAGYTAWSQISERRYLDQIEAEIARLQPMQQRAGNFDRETASGLARVQFLDQYRNRTRADLDTLKTLTRLIEAPAWTNTIDLTRDSVRLQGEAPQAAALWKILDGSHVFASSSLDYNQPAAGGGETFIIRGNREVAK